MSKHASPKQFILHSPSLLSWVSLRHMWPICLPMPANHGFQPQIEWTLRQESSLKNLSGWAGWRAYCTWKTLLSTCSKLPFKRFEIYVTFNLVINNIHYLQNVTQQGSTYGLPVRVPISHCHIYFQRNCHPDLSPEANFAKSLWDARWYSEPWFRPLWNYQRTTALFGEFVGIIIRWYYQLHGKKLQRELPKMFQCFQQFLNIPSNPCSNSCDHTAYLEFL